MQTDMIAVQYLPDLIVATALQREKKISSENITELIESIKIVQHQSTIS